MEVRSRAPGKIILSGEHAVVHGSTAVAASVDLCTHTKLHIHESGDELKLFLKDMALQFSWPLGQIRECLPNLGQPVASAPCSCSQEVVDSLVVLVDEHGQVDTGVSAGILAFIWLYTCIQGFKPATVVVTSDLPLGSGLGSSAAFCVSLSAALLALSDSIVALDVGQKGWVAFGEIELELVNKWAFEGEKIIHGKPSGIDNTVSTYGNVIKFKAGSLVGIKPDLPLKMLITNTRVKRNTKALVSGVSKRTFRYPDVMGSVFKAIDCISNQVCTLIQSDDGNGDITINEKQEKLAELMEMNQGLLQCMGVSHPSIETVLRTTMKYKLVSKLTGAGGGGCVLTLLPTSLPYSIVEEVITELESCGFQSFIASVGRAGVEICFDGSS